MTNASLIDERNTASVTFTITPTDRKVLIAKSKKQRISLAALIREALYHQGLLDP